MDQKNNSSIGGKPLGIIIKKVGETIFIMIGRKTRVYWSRGLQVLPFSSPFKRKAYDGSHMTPR